MRGSGSGQRIRGFVALCDAAFRPMLEAYGFQLTPSATEDKYGGARTYRKADLYISVGATTDPRNGPSYCQVTLGEGSLDWPEVDWNGVALFHLAVARGEPWPEEDPYLITDVSQLPALLEMMAQDLKREASDFLDGDLKRFRAARTGLIRLGRPYQIGEPDGHGGYRWRDDPKSAALMKKFAPEPSTENERNMARRIVEARRARGDI